MAILITIIALGVVIFLHELGHLLAAKKAGVGALEFSIGMGPKLWSKKLGETVYSLRLFPIGGFVKLAGLDDTEEPCEPHLNFYNKTFFQRFLTIAAGPIMNLILGLFIFLALYVGMGKQVLTSQIDMVQPSSPAAAAGLLKGDTIVAVEGQPVRDLVPDLIQKIKASNNKALAFTCVRAGESILISVTPQPNEKGVPSIGIVFVPSFQKLDFLHGVQEAGKQTWFQMKMVFISLKMLVTGQAGLKQMAGPIGIVQFASFGLHQGVYQFMSIMAMISISLGVANLFPFPVLDGGHLLFLGIEAIRGKRLSPKAEAWLINIGAGVLITLMVLIVGNDLLNWQTRLHLFKGLR